MKRRNTIRRSSLLPSALVIMFLWFCVGAVVATVDPLTKGALPLFFILIFLALLFSLSILLRSRRRGAITTIAIISFLLLRYMGVGTLLNLILIIATAIAFELFFIYTSSIN
jgi:hypothetical protein